jgi:PAP_fibrillin
LVWSLWQVKFEKGTISTPKLLDDIELPTSITVLGQPVDLSPLKTALRPVEDAAQGAVRQLASLISSQPDLQFPIPGQQAQTWLINTYLDEVHIRPATSTLYTRAHNFPG